MFDFIEGKIAAFAEGSVVLENHGIGYKISVSNNTLCRCSEVGQEVKLYVHMAVKEDAVALYGFIAEEEKETFLKLTGISGVGAKTALAVLSGFNLDSLLKTIILGDAAAISQIKGVGKKTAERIVLELKEKIDAAALFNSGADTFKPSGASFPAHAKEAEDAAEALAALGYSRPAAQRAVSAGIEKGLEKTEDLIKHALKVI